MFVCVLLVTQCHFSCLCLAVCVCVCLSLRSLSRPSTMCYVHAVLTSEKEGEKASASKREENEIFVRGCACRVRHVGKLDFSLTLCFSSHFFGYLLSTMKTNGKRETERNKERRPNRREKRERQAKNRPIKKTRRRRKRKRDVFHRCA
jgi:hypothetical protein